MNPRHPLVDGVGEESQEDNSKLESVLNNLKAQMWILRFFRHDHQVLWKYGMIQCWNQYACHASQIVNFMSTIEILIKNLKFETWMHNLNFACWIMKKHFSIQNEITFMSFGWKMKIQSRVGLSVSWKVRWRKRFSSLKKCAFSQNGKWGSEWKSWVLRHERVSHFKMFSLKMKTCQKWC